METRRGETGCRKGVSASVSSSSTSNPLSSRDPVGSGFEGINGIRDGVVVDRKVEASKPEPEAETGAAAAEEEEEDDDDDEEEEEEEEV